MKEKEAAKDTFYHDLKKVKRRGVFSGHKSRRARDQKASVSRFFVILILPFLATSGQFCLIALQLRRRRPTHPLLIVHCDYCWQGKEGGWLSRGKLKFLWRVFLWRSSAFLNISTIQCCASRAEEPEQEQERDKQTFLLGKFPLGHHPPSPPLVAFDVIRIRNVNYSLIEKTTSYRRESSAEGVRRQIDLRDLISSCWSSHYDNIVFGHVIAHPRSDKDTMYCKCLITILGRHPQAGGRRRSNGFNNNTIGIQIESLASHKQINKFIY